MSDPAPDPITDLHWRCQRLEEENQQLKREIKMINKNQTSMYHILKFLATEVLTSQSPHIESSED